MPSSAISVPSVCKYGSVALLTSICFLYSSLKMSPEEISVKDENKTPSANDAPKFPAPEQEPNGNAEVVDTDTKINSEPAKSLAGHIDSNTEAENDDLLKKKKKLEKNKRRKERKLATKLKAKESIETSEEGDAELSTSKAVERSQDQAKSKNQKRREKKQTKNLEQKQIKEVKNSQTGKKPSPKSNKDEDDAQKKPLIEPEKKSSKAEKRKRHKDAKKLRLKQLNVDENLVNNTEEITENNEVLENVIKSTSSNLTLNSPLLLGINLFEVLEFFCDCCPVELTGFEAASNHSEEFGHNKMSVVHNSLSDSIKCQSCGETDLSKLHSVLLSSSSLSLCCNDCLENDGFDPLIYSFSTRETLLKYVDNMYRLNSLSCFKCESNKSLAINEDLTCYCANCVENDVDLKNSELIRRSDKSFLSIFFGDPRYQEFKNVIEVFVQESSSVKEVTSSPPSSSSLSALANIDSSKAEKEKTETNTKTKAEKKEKTQNQEISGAESLKDKENNPPPRSLDSSSSEKGESKNSKKMKKVQKNISSVQSAAYSKTNPQTNFSALNSQNFPAKAPRSSGRGPNQAQSPLPSFDSADSKIEDKFERLKKVVKDTLPKNIRLKFDDMNEYNNYLSYSLFLEELFAQDICTEVDFEWKSENQCVMTGPTKLWFDMYVNDDVHHLKKHPFVRDQPIFIVRKSDADLRWDSQPDFWLAHVSGSSLAKIGKRGRSTKIKKHAVQKKTNQISTFTLELYPWNSTKFPVKEKGDRFAFLPGSNVVGRILNSMNKIENESFKNLILGKEKVKIISFNNKINKYFNILNDSQKNALQSALNNTITILQGPPGSGKTSTIYEIILQLLTQLHYYPILVVAASNLAVDNIAEKLMGEHEDIILRITSLAKEKEYPESHPLGSICLHNKISNILPPHLKDIENRLKRNASNVSSSEFSKYLDACQLYGAQMVKQASIIFATTAGIAGPYLKKVKRMPVIIMDEATQSSEPSSLIPLGAQGCNKVILVGDTAQLSVFTRVKSLEMSLFQRVLENGTYENPYMLDTQYRMHPDISHFSREHFYDNKLKDGITAENRKMAGINYPVYFFDHQGVGASETKMFSASGEEFGFSWVNKKEVSYIERILEKLIVDHQVSPSTIGVMTGYAAQRDLIVRALESNKIINPNQKKTNKYVDKEDLSEKKNVTVCNVNGIIVATIDAYQGREMNFVLLSCVRSNEGGNIGFMSDRRRMNVALTRAKYSFILCGDAKCMSSNRLWKEYIEELQSKGYVKNSINDY